MGGDVGGEGKGVSKSLQEEEEEDVMCCQSRGGMERSEPRWPIYTRLTPATADKSHVRYIHVTSPPSFLSQTRCLSPNTPRPSAAQQVTSHTSHTSQPSRAAHHDTHGPGTVTSTIHQTQKPVSPQRRPWRPRHGRSLICYQTSFKKKGGDGWRGQPTKSQAPRTTQVNLPYPQQHKPSKAQHKLCPKPNPTQTSLSVSGGARRGADLTAPGPRVPFRRRPEARPSVQEDKIKPKGKKKSQGGGRSRGRGNDRHKTM